MDVNGYIHLINEVCIAEQDDKFTRLPEAISLNGIIKSFSLHASWNALKDPQSDFVKFLNNVVLD